jgi:hypothetical protein
VPTTADSLPGAIPWQTYRISAVMPDGSGPYHSVPTDGYSIDNLAPAAPGGFAATIVDDGIALDWLAAPEPDFWHYRLHRGSNVDFEPAPENLIAELAEPGYLDGNGTPASVYKLSAVDVHHNPSPWAVALVDPTGAGQDLLLPSRIEQIVPNPFNPQTVITYTVARRGPVRLQLYDARGRQVRTLLAGEQDAGRHRIVWDGRSDHGGPLPSGVYCCKLVAGEVTRLAKLTLVR